MLAPPVSPSERDLELLDAIHAPFMRGGDNRISTKALIGPPSGDSDDSDRFCLSDASPVRGPFTTVWHQFNQVFFDNVRVPRDCLLGELNRGWYIATATLDFERSGIQRVMGSYRTYEDLLAYARDLPVPCPTGRRAGGRRGRSGTAGPSSLIPSSATRLPT